MSVAVILALAGVVCFDVFLLLWLAGTAAEPEYAFGTKLWAWTGILAVFFGFNGLALDQLSRYISFWQ